MKQRRREYDSQEEFVKKAIDAEAKASLQPPSILREIDQRCLRGNRPAHSTGAKSQASSTQDPRDDPVEKPLPPSAPKPSNSSPAGSSETSDKKARREKKKHRRLDQQRDQGRKDTSSTPATGANSGTRKDMSQIMCFNYNKKRHYLRNCSEPRKDMSKNQYQSRRPPLQ